MDVSRGGGRVMRNNELYWSGLMVVESPRLGEVTHEKNYIETVAVAERPGYPGKQHARRAR